MSEIIISSQFDSGAIEVLDASRPEDVRLRLRPDVAANFAQWFHFRMQGIRGKVLTLRFVDMDKSAYRAGWEGYDMVMSYDRQEWFRVPAQFDGNTLTVSFEAEADQCWCAYFEPYSHEQHLDLIGFASGSPHVSSEHLGFSLQGRDMTLLRITDDESPVPEDQRRKIWLIARQHPGESMAEWFAEGFIERLLDTSDPVSRSLLRKAIFHVVPRMNPDGAVLGNLRTNAAGVDLNREWETPTLERSPEVFLVRQKMLETGVDLFIDAHGDEALPWSFVAGCEGVPAYDARHEGLENAFKQAWLAVSPDFQTAHGYPKNPPGQANLKMATAWTGQTFSALAFTVEMPFKDNADLPDPLRGWDGQRSKRLGESLLLPMLAVIDRLR